MRLLIFIITALLSIANANAVFENTDEKNEVLRFFWNEENSILDVETHFYIRNLAAKLLTTDYDFFVINDFEVNAFATEYGLIGINVGLINLTESESELASVVAHEMGHIALEHFARYRAKNKYNDLLAIGGVVLAGLSKNNEVSQALFTSSLAGNLQMQINFTRSNEVEADNYGLKLLKKSKFDDFAMADFFVKLKDNPDAIEYIHTHPLSKNRVINSFISKKKRAVKNSFGYQVVKATIDPLSSFITTNKELVQYLQAKKYFEKHQFNKVIQALKNAKEDLSIILKSRAFAQLKQLSKALELLDKDNFLFHYFKAQAYVVNHKYSKAERILKQINQEKPSVYAYKLLANIYLKQDKTDKYYYNIGKSALLQGKMKFAKQQFILAKNNTQNKDLFDILMYKISNIKDN